MITTISQRLIISPLFYPKYLIKWDPFNIRINRAGEKGEMNKLMGIARRKYTKEFKIEMVVK